MGFFFWCVESMTIDGYNVKIGHLFVKARLESTKDMRLKVSADRGLQIFFFFFFGNAMKIMFNIRHSLHFG